MIENNNVLKANGGYLENNLLIAMPSLNESYFEQSVILLCSHSDDGAMGLIVNREADLQFSTFIEKLKEELDQGDDVPSVEQEMMKVHVGGPVDGGRGFVLHSTDFMSSSSMRIADHLAVTATLGIIKAIVSGQGPKKAILCLGYAGWSAGQLEQEIADNSWLTCPLDEDAVFNPDIEEIYTKSLASIGVELTMLSSMSGRA